MERPMEFESWRSRIEAAEGRQSDARLAVRVASLAARPDASYRLEYNDATAEVIADVDRVGVHVFPPRAEVFDLSRLIERPAEVVEFENYRPDHLPLHPVPDPLADELYRRPYGRRKRGRRRDDQGEPTTLFTPDTRFEFSDTAFP